MKKLLSSLIPGLLLTAACSKSNFEYVDKPNNVPFVNDQHEVKSIQGVGSADILWVIDNSGSMGPYVTQVQNNMSTFINTFTGTAAFPWKMGVISTDEFGQPALGFTTDFNEQTPDNVNVFNAAVTSLNIGGGNNTEKTFEPVMKHLNQFPNFIRNSAAFVMIVISDEPEQSMLSAQNFYSQLLVKKNNNADLIRSYMVLSTASPGCTGTETEYPPSPFTDFITINSSKVYSILCPTYGTLLGNIAHDIAITVTKPRLFLGRYRPLVNTIKVNYKGTDLPGGPANLGGFWLYDYGSNSLYFHDLSFATDPNSDIVDVSYSADIGLEEVEEEN